MPATGVSRTFARRCVNPARCAGRFFLGPDIAQREQSNRLATTLTQPSQTGPWVEAHGGWATFYPTKDDSYHTLVIHLPGLQRTDVGTNDAGDGFMNLPD